MRLLLDTSVLIGGEKIPAGASSAISAVSIAELHHGLLIARDDDTRALRASRLGEVEARFPTPLPIDGRVAREWGRLQAAVRQRGGRPRSRSSDLAIAATANVHEAILVTNNLKDFAIIKDLVTARRPSDVAPA